MLIATLRGTSLSAVCLPRFRRATTTIFALVALLPASAYSQAGEPAAPPTSPAPRRITSDGSCPSADAITAAIESLVPHGGADALPPSTRVEVTDAGDTYRVTLSAEGKERARAYRDAARDCDQRARFVAVFIVLTLMPPELLAESPAKPPPPPEPPPPAPVPTIAAAPVVEPPPRRFRLDVSAAMDFAPAIGDAPATASPGAEIRFAAGSGKLGFTASAGIQPRSSFSVGGLEARQLRVPFDAGARARLPVGPLEIAFELGAAAAVFHASGVNPAMPGGGTRLDVGARGAIALRLARATARIAPVIGVHALTFPKPYEIGMDPAGVIGHMPSLWLGATAGASVSF